MTSLWKWFAQEPLDWVHRNYIIDWFISLFHVGETCPHTYQGLRLRFLDHRTVNIPYSDLRA